MFLSLQSQIFASFFGAIIILIIAIYNALKSGK